jgi:hypothetical protein
MYKFSYENNIDRDNLHMTLPIKICSLCWFIHPYQFILPNKLISGFESWCGYYHGTIVSNSETMDFQHCVETSNGDKHFVDLLFESKEEADDYIKISR